MTAIDGELRGRLGRVVPVATLGRPELVASMADLLGSDACLVPIGRLEDLRDVTFGLSHGIVLIEPRLGAAHGRALHRVMATSPGWTTATFCLPDGRDASDLIECTARFAFPMVRAGGMSKKQSMQALLSQMERLRASIRIIPYLATKLRCADPRLATELVALFASSATPPSEKQVASLLGLTPRSVRRLLVVARMPSWPRLAAASRVLRAWNDAGSANDTNSVVERYGFGSARTLRRQWQMVTGRPFEPGFDLIPSEAIIESIYGRLHERL